MKWASRLIRYGTPGGRIYALFLNGVKFGVLPSMESRLQAVETFCRLKAGLHTKAFSRTVLKCAHTGPEEKAGIAKTLSIGEGYKQITSSDGSRDMRTMHHLDWNRFTLLVAILLLMSSGCTLKVQKPSGGTVSYSWPAKTSEPQPGKAPKRSVFKVEKTIEKSGPRISVFEPPQMPRLPELPRFEQPYRETRPTPNYQTTTTGQSFGQREPRRPTPDKANLSGLELIVFNYRESAGNRAAEKIGWSTPPAETDYVVMSRNDLPILAEPDWKSETLAIIGLAKSGEYFPVLDHYERIGLENPLYRGPSNCGKWVKVRTTTGNEGWISLAPWDSSPNGEFVKWYPPQRAAQAGASHTDGEGVFNLLLGGAVIVVLGIAAFAKLFSSGGARNSNSSGGRSSSSYDSSDYSSGTSSAATRKGTLTSAVFAGRTEDAPRKGWFENDREYKGRVHQEGNERIVEDLTGTAPKKGWFESEDDYDVRVRQEANESVVENTTGSAPSKGWFENDHEYRSRVAQEANEAIIEDSSGSAPSKGWFESDGDYSTRVSQEADEAIVEEATGSAPSKGWFESDNEYRERLSQEADEIKGSGNG